MKALILVGGYGTRLRPLTLSVPKPLIHFCNKSIVEHQIHALVKAGVTKVVLAVAYLPSTMIDAIKQLEKTYGISIVCSEEKEPLGTGGPIRLAEFLLIDSEEEKKEKRRKKEKEKEEKEKEKEEKEKEKKEKEKEKEEEKKEEEKEEEEKEEEECFFVCNSDVICEFPFKELLQTHKQTKAEGTILVTRVSDYTSYGVVVHDAHTLQVRDFVEKPKSFVGDFINAGIYVLNTSVIEKIPLRPTSLEKETFPQLARSGSLYCMHLQGYWADIGQPRAFLEGMELYLERLRKKHDEIKRRKEKNKKCTYSEECTQNKYKNSETNGGRDFNKKNEEEVCKNLTELPHLEEGDNIRGNVIVDCSACVGEGSILGPNVSIGPNCCIGRGCRLINCSLMAGAHVRDYAYLDRTIVGWECDVGKWVRIDGLTVLGEKVKIANEVYVNGAFILPHKEIKESLNTPGQIVM